MAPDGSVRGGSVAKVPEVVEAYALNGRRLAPEGEGGIGPVGPVCRGLREAGEGEGVGIGSARAVKAEHDGLATR